MGRVALIASLLLLLAGACWFAIELWTTLDGAAMPTEGYVAMGLGVFFSLLIGVGLMALVFYSSRRGYDLRAHEQERERN